MVLNNKAFCGLTTSVALTLIVLLIFQKCQVQANDGVQSISHTSTLSDDADAAANLGSLQEAH